MNIKAGTQLGLGTLLVLVGMAANSLLVQAALAGHLIGPMLFTLTRFGSGALILVVIARLRGVPLIGPQKNAFWLFLYAAGFSETYLVLGATMGPYCSFSVQFTMFLVAVRQGERPTGSHVAGDVLALSGLYVLAPYNSTDRRPGPSEGCCSPASPGDSTQQMVGA